MQENTSESTPKVTTAEKKSKSAEETTLLRIRLLANGKYLHDSSYPVSGEQTDQDIEEIIKRIPGFGGYDVKNIIRNENGIIANVERSERSPPAYNPQAAKEKAKRR